MLTELYSWTDSKSETLSEDFGVWLMYFNYQRILEPLDTTPVDKLCERIYDALTGDDVYDSFDPSQERFRDRHYEYDQLLAGIEGRNIIVAVVVVVEKWAGLLFFLSTFSQPNRKEFCRRDCKHVSRKGYSSTQR
jgi:hypothetical protein